MGKMGRPKKKAAELIASGARRGRINARLAEEAPPPTPVAPAGPPEVNADHIAKYLASVKRERSSFAARCVPGEVLSREHGSGFDWPDAGPGYKDHGAIFNWYPCLLTQCRDFARTVVGDPLMADTWASELATRFLHDLATTEHGFVFDVEAAKNVERMIATWSDPQNPMTLLRLLAILEFICWKKRDGENRFPDELLLDFVPTDIAMMDQAFLADQAAFETV